MRAMAESGDAEKTSLQRLDMRPRLNQVWGSDLMLRGLFVAAAFAVWSTAALAGEPDAVAKVEQQQVAEASHLISDQKPGDAVVLLDKVIAANEQRHQDKAQQIYCARSEAEVLLYMLEAAAAKRSAVALDPTYCDAIFLKGFALIDLGQPAEARKYIERAVGMAPHNAYYRDELAESYKTDRDWENAYRIFEQAAGDAREFSPADSKTYELTRALRGMGFVRSEQSRFDEAEKLLRESLQINPDDAKAKSELDYIAKQRARRAAN
jgi:tetratricopeptide (TPR) repeat protein